MHGMLLSGTTRNTCYIEFIKKTMVYLCREAIRKS